MGFIYKQLKQKKVETKEKEKPKEITKTEKTIVDNVLARINTFQSSGELQMPKDYSAENALKSAYLILTETTNKDNISVLKSCTPESVANSLLDMVVKGLSPLKKQCAFVAYGNKLNCVVEYHGNIMLAKRFGKVQKVFANVIYKNDTFEYEIINGVKRVTKHEQSLSNIDNNNIIGAYATLILEDQSEYVEIMNILQIRAAWNQGAAKGASPAHRNFPEEMAKKTVLNRACKLFISTSDDNGVYDEVEKEAELINSTEKVINTSANIITLDIDHKEVIEEKKEVKEEKKIKAEVEIPLTDLNKTTTKRQDF